MNTSEMARSLCAGALKDILAKRTCLASRLDTHRVMLRLTISQVSLAGINRGAHLTTDTQTFCGNGDIMIVASLLKLLSSNSTHHMRNASILLPQA